MTNTIEKDLHSVSSTALFHKVLHHFGDWEIETGYMNRIEKSIYFDMRTLYLRQGAPLTDDLDLLAKRLSCRSDDELIALTFLLKDKFTHCKKTHSYKQKEWDLMIKNYRYRHRNGRNEHNGNVTDNVTDNVTHRNDNVMPLSNAERQQKARLERKKMIDELTQMGIEVNKDMGLTDLRKLYNDKLAKADNTKKQSVTRNDGVTKRNEHSNERNAKNNAITINHKPLTNNHNITNPPNPPRGDGGESAANPVTKSAKAKPSANTLEFCFDTFWESYPRKQARAKARTVLDKILSRADNVQDKFEEVMTGLNRSLPYLTAQATKDGGNFCPHATTWLNGECWLDEPPALVTQKPVNGYPSHAQAHDFTQYLNVNHTPPPNAFDGIVIDGDCQ